MGEVYARRVSYTHAYTPPLASHWSLEEGLVFLNHGSFGATPRAVLDEQARLRAHMESDPMRFFLREYEPRMDAAREALARFVNADPACMAFVTNATVGVNTVLRSLQLAAGDEIVVTSHGYNACNNAARAVADAAGAKVVCAAVPFPLRSPGEVVRAIEAVLTERTRLVLVDHVTSPTGLVLPVREVVQACAARGVDVLVDGAHAPGMLALDVRAIGAAYYTANCHKWLCTPKGSAFLYVREDKRELVRPLVISHGANDKRAGERGRFRLEFDWTGTNDPTGFLCVPYAIELLGSLVPGGWPAIIERNRALALRARDMLCAALGVEPPAPDAMIATLAAVPMPDGKPSTAPSLYGDALQDWLYTRHRIVVPIVPWPQPPARLVRISAQLYNHEAHYELLANALLEGIALERGA